MTNEWNATKDLVDKVTQNLKEGKKDEAKNLIGASAKSVNFGYFTVHMLKSLADSRATNEGRKDGTALQIAKETYVMFEQAFKQAGRPEDAAYAHEASMYL